MSPPARVAWIETVVQDFRQALSDVATREGGVDRNDLTEFVPIYDEESPPARVAWIETDCSD